MRRKNGRPVAIDLFAGGGGFSLGLEQAGFDILLAVDRDPYHVATYQRNFPNVATLCGSVEDLDGKAIRENAALDPNAEIDLICAGPPCQGFSHMGKRDAADPRNALVDDFVRLVLDLRPKAFVLENVPGIQVGASANVIRGAVQRLSRGGYVVTEPIRPLNAEEFGVPQRRERLFVVGVRNDIGLVFEYPTPQRTADRRTPTVWQAICDLPTDSRRLMSSDTGRYRRLDIARLHSYVLAARDLRRSRGDLSYPRRWNKTECSGCLRVRHRPEVVQLYAATAPGASVPAHNLPRLHPDGVAPTLRAGTDSEHGSYNAPRPIHPHEPRCITVREAARLHGYPDWFQFHPRKWHAHRQIGNSVCPPVAFAVGKSIVHALGFKPRKPSTVLDLNSDFVLPVRHKHHGRISQVVEWPKVVQELLSKAGPVRNGRLPRPAFSVADVAAAYESSGARMPRTPPARFLADVARSRNTAAILAPAIAAGFSITAEAGNGAYGRFVPLGTQGTLDDKPFLAISRSEFDDAIRLAAPVREPVLGSWLLAQIHQKPVWSTLFARGAFHLNGSTALTLRGRQVVPFEVVHQGRCLRRCVAIVVDRGELPTLPAVRTILDRHQTGTAVVLAQMTREHFVAFLMRRRGSSVAVTRRRTFELQTDSSPVVPSEKRRHGAGRPQGAGARDARSDG